MKPQFLYPILLLIGGVGYGCIELAARGYTHWTMVVLGGLCLAGLYRLDLALARLPLLVRAAAGAAMVTAAELAAGLVLNCWLGLRIWDYSREPMHLWGQICPRFSLAWYGLCLGAMLAFAGGRALAGRLRRRA